MSRRAFIRWMLGLLVMIGAAGTGLFKVLQKAADSPAAGGDEEAVVLQKPEPRPEVHTAAADGNGPLFSFMILSDLHISTYDPLTVQHMKEALEDIKRLDSPIDTIVITGDLTDYGRDVDYKELKKAAVGLQVAADLRQYGQS
ncbi:hypothetical protein LJK87_30885 [Paenibacillus sp. P25]|nr:hypothetical protein LJK87_30885 [Paenibacillus sp. P25]